MPLDVDPSGKRLIVRPDVFGFGKNGRVDVWGIDGLEPELVASWEPYSSARGSAKDVSFAAFVDLDHVLTVGNRSLTLWHLPTFKAVYSIPVTGDPAVSVGRKYIALESKGRMYVLEAATGKTLAQLQGETGGGMRFSFRPDARRLAMVSGGRLQVWDCEKGERFRDIFLQGIARRADPQWVGDNYVLVAGSHVVDLERRMTLWRYDGMVGNGKVCGGKHCCVVGGGPHGQSLMLVELPHPEAVAAVGRIAPEKLLAVKPGTKMRLEVNLGFSRKHQKEIADVLAARLGENGMDVVEDAPVVFIASANRGEKQSITYRGIGFRGGSETVEVVRNNYAMSIQKDGEEIWKTSSVSGAPSFLSLEQGQTAAQAVAKYSEMNVNFFLKTPLPKLLARPGKYDGAYGVSQVLNSGIKTIMRP